MIKQSEDTVKTFAFILSHTGKRGEFDWSTVSYERMCELCGVSYTEYHDWEAMLWSQGETQKFRRRVPKGPWVHELPGFTEEGAVAVEENSLLRRDSGQF